MDAVTAAATAPPAASPPPAASHLWSGDSFRFLDLLDIVNPLQHIPVVGTIYRALTGDTIGDLPRIAGDALFGGTIGLCLGLVATAVKEGTGKDPGEHVLAFLEGAPSPPAAAPEIVVDKVAPAAKPEAAVIRPDHAPLPLARKVAAAPMPLVAGSARPESAGAGSADAPAVQLRNAPVPLQTSLHLPPPGGGIDIARRMQVALDKYARMQAERTAQEAKSTVDLSP